MEYQYFYTMEYLPTRYEANEREWDNRHAVWNFKDGNCRSSILYNFYEIINSIVKRSKSEYIICFIPASTSSNTMRRFSHVARQLTALTGIQATLTAITKTSDSESGYRAGKSSNPTADFIFNSDLFSGKKVILVDDVITRGRTFTQTADKLIAYGASSVVGLFVAKTVNPDWNPIVA